MFYRGKRLLVTGGSGFVGNHFVRALVEQGARVRVPIHRRPMVVQDPRIERVQADVLEYLTRHVSEPILVDGS